MNNSLKKLATLVGIPLEEGPGRWSGNVKELAKGMIDGLSDDLEIQPDPSGAPASLVIDWGKKEAHIVYHPSSTSPARAKGDFETVDDFDLAVKKYSQDRRARSFEPADRSRNLGARI